MTRSRILRMILSEASNKSIDAIDCEYDNFVKEFEIRDADCDLSHGQAEELLNALRGNIDNIRQWLKNHSC